MTYSQETQREYRELFRKAAEYLAESKGIVLEKKEEK
jgi:hypothetical protein